MANLDHTAIYKAYSNAKRIDGSKVLDTSGNEITIEQSKVDTARTELDTEYAAVKYKDDRAEEYPDWREQLDYIYHNGIDKWKTDIIDPIKTKYPKP